MQTVIRFPFLLAWTSCWTNNRYPEDLWRHDAHVKSLWLDVHVLTAKRHLYYFPFVQGIPRGRHRGTEDQQRVPVWFPVLLVWISCWTNSRVGTNLRRHDVHITPWCPYNTDSVAKQGQNFDKFMHRLINSTVEKRRRSHQWCVDINMQEKT